MAETCAEISFVGDVEGTPTHYFDVPPPPGRAPRFPRRRVAVTLEDARQLPAPALGVEGFELLADDAWRAGDLDEREHIAAHYRPAVAALLQRRMGARRVLVFDHTRRSSAHRVGSALPGGGAAGAVDEAHNDYTLHSGPQRAREVLAELAPEEDVERALAAGWAIVNVWRPTNGPVEQWPLALCDQRTLDPADAIPAELRWHHRTGHVAIVRHDLGQRWCWFPAMHPGEALLFSCFDSRGPGASRFGAHSAFDDPRSPPGARVRESIEVRSLVLFG